MDVIALHQAGFDSAVASLGTSLTPQQANMISRLGKKEIILSYDSDGAGQAAASRGINLLSEAGVRARVLKMNGAKDPDEFIKRFGAEAFRSLIEKSGSAIAYEMDKLAAGLDLNTDDGRAAYLKKAVTFLAQISNDIDRAVYISRAAREASIPVDTIKTAVEREISRNKGMARRKQQNAALHPVPDKINPDALKMPKEEKAERGIICYLYHNPETLEKISFALKGEFVTVFNKRVYEFLVKMLTDGGEPDISLFNEEFDAREMGRIMQIVTDNTFANDKTALADFIDVLNDYGKTPKDNQYGDMSDEELLKLVQKLKEKKK